MNSKWIISFALATGSICISWAQTSNVLSTAYGSVTVGPTSTVDRADINTTESNFLFLKPVNSSTGKFGSTASTLDLQLSGITRLSFNSLGRAYFSTNKVYMPSSSYLFFSSDQIGQPRLSFHHYNNTNAYIDYHHNLFFRNDHGGFSPLVLQGNGNVFIGMNTQYTATVDKTQGFRLAVNGGILCEEVKVILDVPASDYVFEPSYPLMPLDSVEAYVKANKHLPEVPSACEFEENGYKVGEMDDILLRKIEELTLYIIELKKRQGELEAELMNLQLLNK